MQTIDHVITDKQGVHARPVARICAAATPFESTIELEACGRTASAKDLMQVMAASYMYGEKLHVTIEGADEEAAAQALRPVIEGL